MDIVERLRLEGPTYRLMKSLSQYSVNVRGDLKKGDMKKLIDMGAIEELFEGVFVISDKAFYDEKVGLVLENHWLEETYII